MIMQALTQSTEITTMNPHAETAQFIQEELQKTNTPMPSIGIILGSGLGGFVDALPSPQLFKYADLPHFPQSTVSGHSGQLAISTLENGSTIACLQGRFHYYEGHGHQAVAYPVRTLKALGVHTLIVTNAAGGINSEFQAGDLMCITDHINMMGRNPMEGPNNDELGPRFFDMANAYNKDLRRTLMDTASTLNIDLKEGVYAGVLGPCYETPAEIRALKTLGADAVGMSTVPEVIVASHCGIKSVGISCITNMAAGIATHSLNHEEVLETGQQAAQKFNQLLTTLINTL